jgi:hypothetical protein
MGRFAIDALFWLMLATGGGSLAACLLLPAWLELRHAEARLDEMTATVAEFEKKVEATRLQIIHLKRDPEYNERFVRQEFNVRTPGVEVVDLSPLIAVEPDAAASQPAPTDSSRWTATLERQTQENPYLAVFLADGKRPAAMALSGLMLAGAVLLMHARQRVGATPA